MSELADLLMPHIYRLQRSADHGDARAVRIIDLYQMHRRCPSDPGAIGLCKAAFEEWKAIKQEGGAG